MGIKVTIANLFNLLVPSSVASINNNTNKLADEFDKVLYRDGSFNMRGNLDMNGNRVINSGSPIDDNDLATYAQVKEISKGPPGNPGADLGAIGPKTAATGIFIPVGATMVRTSCYSVVGDGGHGDYTLIGADDARVPASAKFVDSLGRWWKLAIRGAVQIEQFGGKADCPFANFDYASFTATYAAPAAGTVKDNLQPYYDAEKFVNVDANVPARNEVGSMIPIEFMRSFDTAKCYWFSDTIVPQYSTHIRGNGNGGDSIKTGTTFRFPPNVGGIKFNHAATQPAGYVAKGSGFSIIEGIWFQGGGGTNRSAHGVHHRVPIRAIRCAFDSFAGNNTHNIGSVGFAATDPRFGLTSGTHFIDVTCRAAGNWNSWIEGSDVSASQFDCLQHKNSRLGGLFDSGYFANTYNNYGNHGHGMGALGSVKYGGRRYALISPGAGIGGTTTPGTNDRVWEDRGADPGGVNPYYPLWVSGGTYELSVPSFISFPGTELDAYIENYYLPQVGGTLRGTSFPSRYSNAVGSDSAAGLENVHTQNFGWRFSVSPSSAAYSILGDQVESKIGGGSGSPTYISAWSNSKSTVGWSMEYVAGGNIRVGLGFAGSGNPMAYMLTDQNTTTTFGRPVTNPGTLVGSNFALGNENGGGEARVHYSFSGGPNGKYFDAGGTQRNRARGEVGFNINPVIGGALMYTSMGDGTTQPVGIVGAVRAVGLSSSSTTAQIVAALQAAGLAE